MNVSCPICRRDTEVDRDIGDFLTRCNSCGNLLRFPKAAGANRPEPRKADRGTLAGMLQATSCGSQEGATATLMPAAISREAKQEAARMQVRRLAIKRAAMRANQEALGTMGWIGVGVATVLAIIAISLKAHDFMAHASTAQSDTAMVR